MLRVVVYAEGSGDTGGGLPMAAGHTLSEDRLGPVHLLVRRCLGAHAEVSFEAPLRAGARVARGSDLVSCRALRRLLTWADPALKPDAAVVVVDRDGIEARPADLRACVESPAPPIAKCVIGVAVEEFESWLIADLNTVRRTLALTIDQPQHVETLPPGHAKQMLGGWLRNAGAVDREVRLGLARTCDLGTVARESRSFQRFAAELRHALS